MAFDSTTSSLPLRQDEAAVASQELLHNIRSVTTHDTTYNVFFQTDLKIENCNLLSIVMFIFLLWFLICKMCYLFELNTRRSKCFFKTMINLSFFISTLFWKNRICQLWTVAQGLWVEHFCMWPTNPNFQDFFSFTLKEVNQIIIIIFLNSWIHKLVVTVKLQSMKENCHLRHL